MQALILAAGMGKRLGALTRDQTKAMVRVNGKTLIARMLDALAAAGIRKATIVTGHGAEHLRREVGDSHSGLAISYVHNSVYATTNNIYSLWLAREVLAADDTILLESDLVFEPRVLADLIANPRPNLAVVAKFEAWMDGTVTVLGDDDRIATMIPKELFDWGATDAYFKTVNIYKFSRAFSQKLYLPFLDAFITAFGHSQFYEQVLTALTQLQKSELFAHRLGEEAWYEIDDLQDLDIAETLFAGPDDARSRVADRYGGFWRFGRVTDFSYLVNPHFPPTRLMRELTAMAPKLVGAYPSGHRVQSVLGARMFDCSPDEIVVGNGAAELIRALLDTLEGRIGVLTPSFDEYARLIAPDRLVRLPIENKDFTRSVQDLLARATDLSALVVVNPDNPSGHYFTKAEIAALRDGLPKRCRLILDESFVDFAEPDGSASHLSSAALAAAPALVVVRSLGKSHGVAGLRLGVLASADRELVRRVRDGLSIWNINAFAEYFLQIVGKYERDYRRACRVLTEERSQLATALSSIEWLRVIPSSANYLLCELRPPFTARELCDWLFEQHRMLLKDCSNKPGLEGQELVRIAVRDASDNQELAGALSRYAGAVSKRTDTAK